MYVCVYLTALGEDLVLSSLSVSFPPTAQVLDTQSIIATALVDEEVEGTEVLGVRIVTDLGIQINANGEDFFSSNNIVVIDDDGKYIYTVYLLYMSFSLLTLYSCDVSSFGTTFKW